MKNQFLARSATLAAMVLVIPHSHAADIANLPKLENGDISISNDIGGEYDMQVTPNSCPSMRIKVPYRKTVAVRCPGAKSVRTFFVILDKNGNARERHQVLEVNKHYSFGWDEELGFYGGKLISLFNDNGTMTR
jgi:hypothetical protein